MRKTLPFLAVGLLVLGSGCQNGQRRMMTQMQGKQAPDFELSALDGKKARLSEFRGKPVILAFWAFG